MSGEFHHHRLIPQYCVHRTGAPGTLSFDRGDLGRGSGGSFMFVEHKGPREACTVPDDVLGQIPPCSRACLHEHQMEGGVCIVCRVTIDELERERLEREHEERERDEARAAAERGFREEILKEMREVFDRWSVPHPSEEVLLALVEIVEDHVQLFE